MKTYKNIFGTAMAVVMGATMIACSADIDDNGAGTAATGYDNLVFNINISAPADYASETRTQPSDGKTTWALNNVIYFMVDNNNKNIGKFTRVGSDGNGISGDTVAYSDWAVSKVLSDPSSFQEGEGFIDCFYSDNSTFNRAAEVITKGDVLYKQSVPYVRKGDTVTINATLDQRPVSKVKFVGMYPWNSKKDSMRIDGFKEFSVLNFTKLHDYGENAWVDQNQGGLTNAVEDVAGSNIDGVKPAAATHYYYGYIPSCVGTGSTTITMRSNDGKVTYTRTFEGSEMSAGKDISIYGPYSTSGQTKWKSVNYSDTLYAVAGIDAAPINVPVLGRFSFRCGNLSSWTETTTVSSVTTKTIHPYYGYDKLTTGTLAYTSDNTDIVSLTGTKAAAYMTMNKVGTAHITASMKPSTTSETDTAYYTVIVKNIEDYLVGKWPIAYAKKTATKTAALSFSLANNSPYDGLVKYVDKVSKGDSLITGKNRDTYVVLKSMYVEYANGTTSNVTKFNNNSGYVLALNADISTDTKAAETRKYYMDKDVELTYLNGSTLVITFTFNKQERQIRIPFTGSVDAAGNVTL